MMPPPSRKLGTSSHPIIQTKRVPAARRARLRRSIFSIVVFTGREFLQCVHQDGNCPGYASDRSNKHQPWVCPEKTIEITADKDTGEGRESKLEPECGVATVDEEGILFRHTLSGP
jgi:hypothetical protein